MTLEVSERLVDLTASLLSDLKTEKLISESELRGFDVTDVSRALKLRIARQFLEGFDDVGMLKKSIQVCQFAYDSLLMLLVSDSDAKKLRAIPNSTPEFNRTFSCFMESNYQRLNRVSASYESFDSFADYCVIVGTQDPEFWKKIYARVNLSYTLRSPKGNPKYEKFGFDTAEKPYYNNVLTAFLEKHMFLSIVILIALFLLYFYLTESSSSVITD